jgi:hypothetical protein
MRRLASVLIVACACASALAAPPAHAAGGLSIVASTATPNADYEAEVYSGVPLDGAYARERGLGKGLVWMVFEKQRRAAFRVPHEKIRKLVRLVADDVAPVMVVKTSPVARTKIDVLETQDGLVVVETVTANAGIFTTSDVYVFPRGAAVDARLASVAPAARERVRHAVALAQSAATPRPAR